MDDFSGMLGYNSKTVSSGSSPIKQLPFSPSQFFNSPGLFGMSIASTPKRFTAQASTPVKNRIKSVS